VSPDLLAATADLAVGAAPLLAVAALSVLALRQARRADMDRRDLRHAHQDLTNCEAAVRRWRRRALDAEAELRTPLAAHADTAVRDTDRTAVIPRTGVPTAPPAVIHDALAGERPDVTDTRTMWLDAS